jgi:hypothetical protein
MAQPLIIDVEGIVHGVKWGTYKKGIAPATGTVSWCGTSLVEWVRLGGGYSSVEHQDRGYDPRHLVTCLGCLSEGP